MRSTGLFVLLLLNVIQVQSDDKVRDYFIMSEAYIQEYRFKEDANAGFQPFFAECSSTCRPATPQLSEKEGYVIIVPSQQQTIVYGCLDEKRFNIFNQPYFNNALILKNVVFSTPHNYNEMYLNIYKYKCLSAIPPTIWRTEDGKEGSYNIGYKFIQHDPIPLAHVVFDHDKAIPLMTKHNLYGASLAAPMGTFKSVEELIYQHPNPDLVHELKRALQSYYDFNNPSSETRKELKEYLNTYGIEDFPQETELSMAHLVPEYDMVMSSWTPITRFAQTIVPMWTELYLSIWADIEEMIREYAFMHEKTLTVYSGTHGQLTLTNAGPEGDENPIKFFLNKNNVAVSEFVWKLVINDSKNKNGKPEAIAIIMSNLTAELKDLEVFTTIKPPCSSKCADLDWNKIVNENIYCCSVEDVRGLIDEFPDIAKSDEFQFDKLLF